VYTLNADGTVASKTPIRTAGIYGDVVAVREGLPEGATVITKGTAYLTDGARVQVANDRFRMVNKK
jgi:multidrug efflux pump subunit AcrA (membrane-fusion protein)